jgi:hypothetical protein
MDMRQLTLDMMNANAGIRTTLRGHSPIIESLDSLKDLTLTDVQITGPSSRRTSGFRMHASYEAIAT